MKYYKLNKSVFSAIFLMLLAVWIVYDVYATSTGRSMRTSTLSDGCGGSGCHGTSKNTATTLTFTGNQNVETGSTNNFTISVNNSDRPKAGINVAVKTSITGEDDGGELTAGSGMKKILAELAHSTPMDISSGKADFSFQWKAPDLPGVYYLRAIGNAVNYNNSPDNQDQWNWMDVKTITVVGIAITEPVGAENLCAGSAYTIKWKSAGITKIKIELSSDGGANYTTTLLDNFDPVGGSWVWNVPSGIQQGTNYKMKISDVSNPGRFSESTNKFNIFGPFSIKTHPVSTDICLGGSLTLSVEVLGTGVLYQWRKNGQIIPDANSPTYTINNANSSHTGYYGCWLSSPCGSAQLTNDAQVNVRALTVIKSQPISRAACKGETVSFEVSTDGQSVKYQWFKNGAELANDTMPILKIPNVDINKLGTYWVMVSGFCKPDLKSNEVTLTINSAPEITSNTTDLVVCEKKKVEFSVDATGEELKYQWRFNGTNITTGTLQKLTIASASLLDAGNYDCVVSNNCGSATSPVNNLRIDPLPKITKQPLNLKIMEGSNAVFEVDAQFTDSYQWKKGTQNITDEISKKLVLFNVKQSDAGVYECVLTNSCGTVTTVKCNLTVDKPAEGPRLQLSETKINFGTIKPSIPIDSTIKAFISNNGTDTLKISKIKLTGTNLTDFSVTTSPDTIKIPKDSSFNLNVQFTAKDIGLRVAVLEFQSNSITDPGTISLEGFGAFFDIRPSIKTVDFFDVFINDSSELKLRLTNYGNYSETITKYELIDPDNVFQIKEIDTILEKDYIEIPVKFFPKGANEYNGKLNVYFTIADSMITVNLNGHGIVNSVFDLIESNTISVFPNPSMENVIIKFNEKISENFELSIFDLDGKFINKFENKDLNYDNSIFWNFNNNNDIPVANGKYICLLKFGNKIGSFSIIVNK